MVVLSEHSGPEGDQHQAVPLTPDSIAMRPVVLLSTCAVAVGKAEPHLMAGSRCRRQRPMHC